ncbi:MFS transporter [Thiohalobacter sp. IOR34]|uniref:MFS transporter n=1 Tax=Thiohalobacter sp. IOR34 TaxID=3057176 RepID=UPI0025B261B6|nr:MFS transporter [Thiohalobacter sp. IOR34]WJW75019.1 MFS transporter [Thiohalobacter sp. IOR34]
MTAQAAHSAMTAGERRAAVSLAGIFSMRMLGLFMILPVFTLHSDELRGATPALMGFAIGAYGMTQALLQIPFGLLSDRLGRKPVIAVGLLLFAAGSVLAAVSDDIYTMIAARALQGSGAIAAAIMALAADLTREEHRTKAMAIIGMSIGLSFSVALVAGPVFDHWLGLSGIFWLTALMALAGIGILYLLVPQPVISRVHRDAEPVPAQFMSVLRDTQLLRLDYGILSLHMILTASFVALPLVLRDRLGLPIAHHWWIYLPVLLLAVAAMVPFVIQAEKRRRMKQVFVGAVLTLVLAELGLAEWGDSLAGVAISLFVFYVGFNVLEATLPSLISKMAPPDSKGTAMGFYSSSQFLGAFLGGTLGGVLLGHFGEVGVFLFCALVALLWALVASSMKQPRYLMSRLVAVGEVDAESARRLAQRFTTVRGVAEAVVIAEEGVAYLKVDGHALDEAALEKVAENPV